MSFSICAIYCTLSSFSSLLAFLDSSFSSTMDKYRTISRVRQGAGLLSGYAVRYIKRKPPKRFCFVGLQQIWLYSFLGGSASLHRLHRREQQHVADARAVGEQHAHAVDAVADAARGRHADFHKNRSDPIPFTAHCFIAFCFCVVQSLVASQP